MTHGGQQWPGPATALLGLLGEPVAHSGSPAMHNAAFRALDLDACYLAFDLPAGNVAKAVRGFQAAGALGFNVTVPHKEQALTLAHRVTPRAQATGAANVLSFRDGEILADNTDGEGFLRAVQAAGLDLTGRTVLMIGAGGAARAVAVACANGGAGRLVIVNRTAARTEALLAQVPLGGTVGILAHPADLHRWLPRAHLIIQATSLGLQDDDPLPLPDWEGVRPDAVAFDLLYKAEGTPFLHKAQKLGLRSLDGRAMLVWQAALSWEVWFDELGPVDIMAAALEQWLQRRP